MNKIIKTIMDGGKRAAMYTSMMVCAIALISLYSCSADGEYDEPWVNKEHRTRAASDVYYIESRGNEHYSFGDERLSVNATLSWESGRAGNPWPALWVNACDTTKLDATVCDINYVFRWFGSSEFPQIIVNFYYNYFQTTDSILLDGTNYRIKKDGSFQKLLDLPSGSVVTGPGPNMNFSFDTDSCITK